MVESMVLASHWSLYNTVASKSSLGLDSRVFLSLLYTAACCKASFLLSSLLTWADLGKLQHGSLSHFLNQTRRWRRQVGAIISLSSLSSHQLFNFISRQCIAEVELEGTENKT